MMADPSSFVVEVSEQNIQTEVLEKSKQVPVLVDFWAPWCGPCRSLGPTLEKLAQEYEGGFVLAKLNTEQHPRLAMEFGIQSIPHVMLFKDGRVADQFIGAYPESAIRKFLEPHCPTEADKLYAVAEHTFQAGKHLEAEKLLGQILELDSNHSASHLLLAKHLLSQGKVAEALQHVDAIPVLAREFEAAQHLKEAANFFKECEALGGEESCRKRLEQNRDDLDARFGLASCLAAHARYAEALEEFLAIVARDKSYRDEGARKAMLTIFSVIGERSQLSDEYRTRLARTLY
ncbi:MAG: thioredoxin [Acidobacteriota bacterium]